MLKQSDCQQEKNKKPIWDLILTYPGQRSLLGSSYRGGLQQKGYPGQRSPLGSSYRGGLQEEGDRFICQKNYSFALSSLDLVRGQFDYRLSRLS
jgi:hypothetical protein